MQFGCIQRLDFTGFRIMPLPDGSENTRAMYSAILLKLLLNRVIQWALVDSSMRLNNNKHQLDLIDLVGIRKHSVKETKETM